MSPESRNSRHVCTPQETNSYVGRTLDQQLMQNSATNRHCSTVPWESCICRKTVVEEAYSAKWPRVCNRQPDAKVPERQQTIWQQAFPARLVDGRRSTVGNQTIESAQSRRAGQRQAGRSAAANNNIGRAWNIRVHFSGYQRSNTNSEQNPGPMAASKPSVPGSGRRFFITSSSTTRTEADDRLPTLRKHSHDASSSPLC